MNIWIRRLLTLVVALPGLLFITMGLRWLVDPAGSTRCAVLSPGRAEY